MTEIELAYAAGIIDGEGYIGIKKSKAYRRQGRTTPGYHARIQVRRVAAVVLRLRSLQANGQRHRTKITGYRPFPNQHGTIRMVANRSFSDAYVARCERLWSQCRTLNHAPGWANSATA